ncbi:MAG: hypothetical protein N3A38_08920 [Planctomycetota bacterium]|nr:hypothetical protein [Planctomycetota bacterium]
MSAKPELLVMALCDMALQEAGTGKFSLIGTFNRLWAGQFPCVHPFMTVFASLTEGRGEQPIELRMLSDGDMNVLIRIEGRIRFSGPMDVVEVKYDLHNVRFPREGAYSFELWVGGHIVGRRRLDVRRFPAKPPEGVPEDR